VADASCPIDKCMVPCIRPLANNASTASSKDLIDNKDSRAANAAGFESEINPDSGPIKGVMELNLSSCTFVQI
jgi:hypothetical protein